MAGVTIRDARIEDCEQILVLMKELALQEGIDGVKADVEYVLLSSVFLKALRRDGFGNIKRFHCFVAETFDESSKQNEIVGILLYTWLPKILKHGTVMYLEDLFVKERWRGRGIGRGLMERAIKVCKEKKYFRIQLTTILHHPQTLEFYQKFGATNDSAEHGWQITNIIIKKQGLMMSTFDGPPSSPLVLRQDGFGPNKKFHCFVADDPSQSQEPSNHPVVGILIYTWLPKILKRGTVLYIEDVYVKKKYRSQGIGRQLMDRAIKVSRENNYIRVQLTVNEKNQRALEFYKQFGSMNDSSENGWQIINIYT